MYTKTTAMHSENFPIYSPHKVINIFLYGLRGSHIPHAFCKTMYYTLILRKSPEALETIGEIARLLRNYYIAAKYASRKKDVQLLREIESAFTTHYNYLTHIPGAPAKLSGHIMVIENELAFKHVKKFGADYTSNTEVSVIQHLLSMDSRKILEKEFGPLFKKRS